MHHGMLGVRTGMVSGWSIVADQDNLYGYFHLAQAAVDTWSTIR
jgi:hypothetical protein